MSEREYCRYCETEFICGRACRDAFQTANCPEWGAHIAACQSSQTQIVEKAFSAFDEWCGKYRDEHPDCELSVLELAEIYGDHNVSNHLPRDSGD